MLGFRLEDKTFKRMGKCEICAEESENLSLKLRFVNHDFEAMCSRGAEGLQKKCRQDEVTFHPLLLKMNKDIQRNVGSPLNNLHCMLEACKL